MHLDHVDLTGRLKQAELEGQGGKTVKLFFFTRFKDKYSLVFSVAATTTYEK